MATQAIEPHRQLPQVVADRLRSDIVEGRIRPGEWLRQQLLARQYGVSQMPVREALKQLVSEGLVEHVPFRGVRVVKFTREDVEDLYALRASMEGMAAREAARVITADEMGELEALHGRMSECDTPELLPEYRELNRRFHSILFSASRRPLLIRLLTQLWTAFPMMLWNCFPETARSTAPGRDPSDTAEHQAILDALRARDCEGAERAARRHIEESRRFLLGSIRSDRH